jgi:hypothetical protein
LPFPKKITNMINAFKIIFVNDTDSVISLSSLYIPEQCPEMY